MILSRAVSFCPAGVQFDHERTNRISQMLLTQSRSMVSSKWAKNFPSHEMLSPPFT